jgi:hypothetical protein
MRTLSVSLAFVILTGLAVAVYVPTTGLAEGARQVVTPSPLVKLDLASVALQQADALATDPAQTERAVAHYRACLALESAGGDARIFANARQRLQVLLARTAPKGTVQTLAAKIEPTKGQPRLLAVKSEPTAEAASQAVPSPTRSLTRSPIASPVRSSGAISVGPDGLVYDEAP